MGPDCIIASFLEQFALSRADVILSPSLLLIKELKLCNRDKTVIIPHAIDVLNDLQSVFYTEPVILFLAHIQRLKAPEVLIEAFRIIKKCIPQAKILFVGNNTTSYYFEHIKELTDSIDGCEFLGYIPRDKLLPIFSRIRVLAMPSRFENFPMAAIETMAAGRPVVVTSMSGIAELINQKGGGIVVPPSNPKALSQALIPFLLDVSYADRIGIQAKMIVKNQLNPDIIVLQKERVYNQAISNFVRGSNNKK